MKKRKDKQIEGDDGRTIANMNVEGMPWYREGAKNNPAQAAKGDNPLPELSEEEKKAFTGGVLKAALLIAAIYIAVFLGFIFFCVYIWFR